MKTQKLFLIATILFSMSFASCKKVEGCKDRDSINYNPDAESDDGSCRYEGSIVFWQQTPVVSCNVYLDGTFVGNSNVAFSSAPSCGNAAALTIKKDLGGNKSKSYNLKLSWAGQPQVDYGTITFDANTCASLLLE